ncbi:hypothetical protein EV586_103668 [Tumebacillus sp. BK434]|nr:hypothetical protein EV586_103668 [Tumebacillus sp. BK434]
MLRKAIKVLFNSRVLNGDHLMQQRSISNISINKSEVEFLRGLVEWQVYFYVRHFACNARKQIEKQRLVRYNKRDTYGMKVKK